eukprot:SAG31_NODE_10166_length_1176_cov_0.935933_2_plen_157_part_00
MRGTKAKPTANIAMTMAIKKSFVSCLMTSHATAQHLGTDARFSGKYPCRSGTTIWAASGMQSLPSGSHSLLEARSGKPPKIHPSCSQSYPMAPARHNEQSCLIAMCSMAAHHTHVTKSDEVFGFATINSAYFPSTNASTMPSSNRAEKRSTAATVA